MLSSSPDVAAEPLHWIQETLLPFALRWDRLKWSSWEPFGSVGTHGKCKWVAFRELGPRFLHPENRWRDTTIVWGVPLYNEQVQIQRDNFWHRGKDEVKIRPNEVKQTRFRTPEMVANRLNSPCMLFRHIWQVVHLNSNLAVHVVTPKLCRERDSFRIEYYVHHTSIFA